MPWSNWIFAGKVPDFDKDSAYPLTIVLLPEEVRNTKLYLGCSKKLRLLSLDTEPFLALVSTQDEQRPS
jgi:hypothetical protein